MELMTIGFTQTSAEHFFKRLQTAGVKRVIDVRLNNTSQLAGFAKAQDLAWFLRVIGGIDYVYEPLLAPTEDMLAAYKKEKGDWGEYERRFLALLEQRRVEDKFTPTLFDRGCLLCSEATSEHCHRRLVAEYLRRKWSEPVAVRHL
ncbi:MAG TPA: DUF488 domain-containing protein [Archangium sp.]|jgi:uncharacterized protein (DUF488 family)|uniref:DUF488 domain-containing protein n=1 Tax=Archangium sp. TaxID=1872627 RepID=UPI002E317090|nr:DUF488 domain-containing protein [Archangium sp.]HEX5753875.1 DUF488 domain-containing protein [Archangium sp.]